MKAGADDAALHAAGWVSSACAAFREEEGVRNFFRRRAGEAGFMSARLFAFSCYYTAPRGAFDARGLLCVSFRLFAGHGDYAAHFAPSPPSARAAAQADARNRRSRTPAHDAALSVALDPDGFRKKNRHGRGCIYAAPLYFTQRNAGVSHCDISGVAAVLADAPAVRSEAILAAEAEGFAARGGAAGFSPSY